MYLLDTNIVSLLDPRRYAQSRPVVDWIRGNGDRLYLSVITLAELEAGILKLRREGKSSRAEDYVALRVAIEEGFAQRILPMDRTIALTSAHLAERARPTVIEIPDLIIAATAQVHRMTVLTRNLRHFAPTGVALLDPLATLPPEAAR